MPASSVLSREFFPLHTGGHPGARRIWAHREINYYEIANKFIMIITFPFLAFAQIQGPPDRRLLLHEVAGSSLMYFQTIPSLRFLYGLPALCWNGRCHSFHSPWFLADYNTIAVLVISYLFLVIYLFDVVANFIGNTFIISTGHAKINMVNLVLFGIANVVFDILFVHFFGFMGIAYAKFPVVILGSSSLIYFYWRAISRMPGGRKGDVISSGLTKIVLS